MKKIYHTLLVLIATLAVNLFSASSASAAANDLISAQYGQNWMRLQSKNLSTYVWALNQDGQPSILTQDAAKENQLWCFVGSTSGFKIFNHALGEEKALGYGDDGLAMVDADKGSTFRINTSAGDFSIVCTQDGEKSVAPAEGADSRLILMAANSSTALVNALDANGMICIKPQITPAGETVGAYHQKVAAFTYILNDESSAYADVMATGTTLYLPMNTKVELQFGKCYAGYELTGNFNGTHPAKDNSTIEPTFKETNGNVQFIFSEGDALDGSYSVPYRIPAIVQAKNGDLIVFSDERYSGNDIGRIKSPAKSYRIDIVARVSRDGGKTWGPKKTILKGNGDRNSPMCGYGDPAVVANSESNEILLMCVMGAKTDYTSSTRSNPMRICRTILTLENEEWVVKSSDDVTDQIYGFGAYTDNGAFNNLQSGLFFTSGRILQSTKRKQGNYYRIFSALPTKQGVFVLFSDDFGQTWQALGGNTTSPIPSTYVTNETKVEEMPNGNILISMRRLNGRVANIFYYTNYDTQAGRWASAAVPTQPGADCNGELLFVDAISRTGNTSGQQIRLALLSVPIGTNRSQVGIYHRELTATSYRLPSTFINNWNGNPYIVTPNASAYSSMVQLADNKIGFVWEEMGKEQGTFSYNIAYQTLDISTITNGRYVATDPHSGIDDPITISKKPHSIYDLQGRRVENPKKGLYIVDGQKIIFK